MGLWKSDRGRHIVYRIYGTDGRLNYVGITSRSLATRIAEHRNTTRFGPGELHRVQHARYPTRSQAAAVERRLIRQHRPRRNVDHNPTGSWHRPPANRRYRRRLAGGVSSGLAGAAMILTTGSVTTHQFGPEPAQFAIIAATALAVQAVRR